MRGSDEIVRERKVHILTGDLHVMRGSNETVRDGVVMF